MTVVAFLIFPARTNNFNVESLRGHAVSEIISNQRRTISIINMRIWFFVEGYQIFKRYNQRHTTENRKANV